MYCSFLMPCYTSTPAQIDSYQESLSIDMSSLLCRNMLFFKGYLFNEYLNHMMVKFEQNRMVRTIENFELSDKKCLTSFGKELTPFGRRFCD